MEHSDTLWATASADELKSLLDALGNPVFVIEVGTDGHFRLYCNNRRHEAMTGLRYPLAAGRSLDELVPANVAVEVAARYRHCLDSAGPVEYEEHLALPSGTRWWNTAITPIRAADGRIVRLLGSCFDITAQKAAEQRVIDANKELESLALIDDLTGAWNRRYFDQTLGREFARARRHRLPLSIALVDLDHFKQLNDELGHLAGDEALAIVSELLRVQVRDTDIVARYGGEEFALILPHTAENAAVCVVDRCRRSVEGYSWECRPVTLSAGVAVFGEATRSPLDLVRRADGALYAAKAGGRNQTITVSELAD